MSKNYMYHFKHRDGSITFIGWNEQQKVYSTNYYANVGLLNSEESKPLRFREVKILTWNAVLLGFKEVTYLPKEEH